MYGLRTHSSTRNICLCLSHDSLPHWKDIFYQVYQVVSSGQINVSSACNFTFYHVTFLSIKKLTKLKTIPRIIFFLSKKKFLSHFHCFRNAQKITIILQLVLTFKFFLLIDFSITKQISIHASSDHNIIKSFKSSKKSRWSYGLSLCNVQRHMTDGYCYFCVCLDFIKFLNTGVPKLIK